MPRRHCSGIKQLLDENGGSGGPKLPEAMRTRAGAITPREVNRMNARPTMDYAWPPPPGDRITVALMPKVADELQRLQERTSMSKTDLTNRAITSYAFLDDHIHAGHDVMVRDPQTGETQLVRFL
jgi:hypothetical protein